MSDDTRALYRTLKAQFELSIALILISRFLLLEEEGEEEEEEEGAGLIGGYGSRRPRALPESLLEHERAYLNSVDDYIAAYSRNGKIRRRRYVLLSIAALGCASSVPVSVAANAPGWVAAGLGAGAAILQGSEQLLQDQRIGAESHAMAVLLSQELRRFLYKVRPLSDSQIRAAFNKFVDQTEEIHDKQGSVLLELIRQDGPAGKLKVGGSRSSSIPTP